MQHRRRLWIAVFVLASVLALGAQTGTAFSQTAVEGTAVAITTSTTYKTAFCTVETASIRWTFDGTTPTSSVGHVAYDGDALQLTGNVNLRAFRAIRATATSAALSCTFSQ